MKRLLNIFLILVFATLIYILFKFLPDLYLGLGKDAYLKKDYNSAYNNLKTALIFSPKNLNVRYYYAKTLLNLKPTFDVQKELFKITQTKISDSANMIASRQIAIWKSQILMGSGENYIEKAPSDGQILRWDTSKFPLQVYFKNNSTNAPSYFVPTIQRAFLQWQGASSNLIRFNFTNDEKEANIVVSINSSKDMKQCDQVDCKYTVAYTTPDIDGSLLKKMDILFYDSNNLGQPFSQKEIFNTAIHEIGHSLGIMGHSENPDNIMFMESNPNEQSYFENLRSDFQSLSQADINTLNLLYKLVPDVTNTPLNEFNTDHQFYPHIILGSDEQITSQKIIEAQNYIQRAPDLPNGYIDLAAAYEELKKYDKSLDALEQALQHSSTNAEKFMVYYNTAVIYMSLKDWQNCLQYSDLANQADPTSPDAQGLMAMAYYNMGHRAEAKQAYAEAIAAQPDNVINSYNLAMLYLKEFNFPMAGRTLKDLIQANPDAQNDPRIKFFSFLTVFSR